MPFINNFIKRKQKEIIARSNNAVKTLNKSWRNFLKKDAYIIYDDRSKFLQLVKNRNKATRIPWYLFWSLKLRSCKKSNLEQLKKYERRVPVYNQNFVIQKRKEYKNLFERGALTLDDEQQTAIITDDKHNLVVAGAGSGKTEVLITRIAYLIKRKSDQIKPERILALAFQNKAADEMQKRLKKRYDIDVEIRTFHSLGKKIIHDASKDKASKVPRLKEECSEDWKYQKYIQKIFETEIVDNGKLRKDIVNFMKRYNDEEVLKQKEDFERKKEFYKYQRSLRYTALDGTKVRSEAEREILDFFLMHKLNGRKINIRYEHPAGWMKYKNKKGEEIIPKPDFYFPDFDIYCEHWGIGKNGKVPEWFEGKNPTKEYTQTMNLKKDKYRSNHKLFFETSHPDHKKRNFKKILSDGFLSTLARKRKRPKREFALQQLSYRELVEATWECAKSVKQFPFNISRFIQIAKTYRLYPEDIEKRLEYEKWFPKQYSFAKAANQIYEIYQKKLEEGNFIDFADMINVAVGGLRDSKEFYKDKYDHILIDEYQDISTQRYEMIKELMKKNSKCKLFCVGDDWQSIMGFASSNLDFFINFKNYFPHPARTDLIKNYRSVKSIVQAGACIIKNNNDGQIKKKTTSDRKESKPILVFSSGHDKKAVYHEQTARRCLSTIKEYCTKKNYSYGDFMILMRIAKKPKLRAFISDYANSMGIPISNEAKIPNRVHIMSVHKSKGLQAKVVMVLNVDKDLYGFPCELENPVIFLPTIKNNDGLRKQEERRLFYVAVTRAKEEVMIYTQKCSESEFIMEIKDFVKKEEFGC